MPSTKTSPPRSDVTSSDPAGTSAAVQTEVARAVFVFGNIDPFRKCLVAGFADLHLVVAREELERVGDGSAHDAVDRHLGAGRAAVAAGAQIELARHRRALQRHLDRCRLSDVQITLRGLPAAQLDDHLDGSFGHLDIERRVAGDPEITRRRRCSRVPVDRRLLRRAVDVDLVAAAFDPGTGLHCRRGGALRRGRPFARTDDTEQRRDTDQQGDPRE